MVSASSVSSLPRPLSSPNVLKSDSPSKKSPITQTSHRGLVGCLKRRDKDRSELKISATPIRFRTSLRNTVCDVMKGRKWREADSETDWDFFWTDVHWIFEFYDQTPLRDHQKINHFKNHYELTRKDLLVKNVKRFIKDTVKKYGKQAGQSYDFIAPSYVLPQEHALFQEEFKRNPKSVWIMKPVGKAQGKGIFLINRLSQISQWKKDPRLMARNENGDMQEGPEAYIIQKYIEKPYLIGGKKFDIRIYVLVTSFNPLTVYIHRNGFCRFSNSEYSLEDISNIYIHATNVAIQKTSPNYSQSKGCKWLLRNLKLYIASKHGQEVANNMFADMEAMMVRALLSVQKLMINDKHCFELYGYDILIDENLKPWLLEINASPSLTAETQWDYDLKYNMLNDVFDIVDIERRFTSEKLRTKVGGFDLVYHDGPVKHATSSEYKSYLGGYCPITPSPKTIRKQSQSQAKVELDV
ncbi:putative tubulin tyrosine ligase protein [Paraphysoderma sedebokerense]|nr:putative tubulin tyrosine ligase protein [Paraphysoderma sedebokerense]